MSRVGIGYGTYIRCDKEQSPRSRAVTNGMIISEEKLIFLQTCETSSELPTYISTMGWTEHQICRITHGYSYPEITGKNLDFRFS